MKAKSLAFQGVFNLCGQIASSLNRRGNMDTIYRGSKSIQCTLYCT